MTNNAQDSLIEKIPDTLAVRELDRFVKITEAARILGYASYQSVKQLVDEQILISYSLPETSRPRLLLSELLVLKARKDNSLSNSISHKITENRGRPKKYGVH